MRGRGVSVAPKGPSCSGLAPSMARRVGRADPRAQTARELLGALRRVVDRVEAGDNGATAANREPLLVGLEDVEEVARDPLALTEAIAAEGDKRGMEIGA